MTPRTWTCQRTTDGVRCRQANLACNPVCSSCGKSPEEETRNCARCGEKQPLDNFYFVSKKLGTRRGQCKTCMAEIKAMQKDPSWRPSCNRCGKKMERFGPGRRLCRKCFDGIYDAEAQRADGSHLLALKPCSCCGEKRLREDHTFGSSLCPICRSVPQGRRRRLKLYNMTPRDFLMLLDEQAHSCWICERPFTKQLPANVEHKHSDPMIVRGLVCATCNTLLALAKDNPDRLCAAAKFLEAPPAQYLLPGLCASPEANRIQDRQYAPLKRGWGSRSGVKEST